MTADLRACDSPLQAATPPAVLRGLSVPGRSGIDLLWLPLGARGRVARLSGLVFEGVVARLEGRRPLALYHSALEVRVPEARFVIETQGAIPDQYGASRGVVREGPVWSRRLAKYRFFRYELRCWRDGVIADAEDAVESPRPVADDEGRAHRVLELVEVVPLPVWGRDELRAGEMWNSNSVIAWLLARSGVEMDALEPPSGGRAPGWAAGLVVAGQQRPGGTGAPHAPRGSAAVQRASSPVTGPADCR